MTKIKILSKLFNFNKHYYLHKNVLIEKFSNGVKSVAMVFGK